MSLCRVPLVVALWAVGALGGCREGPPAQRHVLPLSVISAPLPAAVESRRAGGSAWPPAAGFLAVEQQQAQQEAAYDVRYPYHGVAFHVLAQVFREPRPGAGVSGYLRRGARLRAAPGVSGPGCDTRWHEVDGGGFVCAGRGFVLGRDPQTFSPAPAPPDRHAQLPYRYGRTMARDVPQYARLPTAEEEAAVAVAIARIRADNPRAPSASAVLFPGPAEPTAPAEASESVEATRVPSPLPGVVRTLMRPGFYVSIDGHEDAPSGKTYARTVRGAYVAADRLQAVTPSPFHGMKVTGGLRRPLGFVAVRETETLVRAPARAGLAAGPSMGRFEPFEVVGALQHVDERDFVPGKGGLLVPARAVRIARRRPRPKLVPSTARWIDIDLEQQVLVAYEGDRPVFGTLVATGKTGFETPTGLFRIHAKHVSATMDGAVQPDEVYSIEDVPWTMYFNGSLALHGAFWHDRFGRVRSHGCVNLTPGDARWLFEWTSPVLPPGFHGVLPAVRDESTYVLIRDSRKPDS